MIPLDSMIVSPRSHIRRMGQDVMELGVTTTPGREIRLEEEVPLGEGKTDALGEGKVALAVILLTIMSVTVPRLMQEELLLASVVGSQDISQRSLGVPTCLKDVAPCGARLNPISRVAHRGSVVVEVGAPNEPQEHLVEQARVEALEVRIFSGGRQGHRHCPQRQPQYRTQSGSESRDRDHT